jgi:hypothetical protein
VDGGGNDGDGQQNVTDDIWENMTRDDSEEEKERQKKMYNRIRNRKRRNILCNSSSSFDT